MLIDTSATMAILRDEPERPEFIRLLEAAPVRHMSTATFVETSVVIPGRRGAEGLQDLDDFLQRYRIELIPLDRAQALIAREAFRRFGKGRHPAALNFGDCFSYALARHLGEPLLCKGADFPQTDIPLAI